MKNDNVKLKIYKSIPRSPTERGEAGYLNFAF